MALEIAKPAEGPSAYAHKRYFYYNVWKHENPQSQHKVPM